MKRKTGYVYDLHVYKTYATNHILTSVHQRQELSVFNVDI